MNWKVAIALGAAIGGAVYAVLRKNRNASADAELWAEATDPVARFDNPCPSHLLARAATRRPWNSRVREFHQRYPLCKVRIAVATHVHVRFRDGPSAFHRVGSSALSPPGERPGSAVTAEREQIRVASVSPT